MSPEEAVWIGKELSRISEEELSPLINLGSSTEEYRTRVAPHIETHIFGPLRDRGVTIYHVDMKQARGVDIVGSILDEHVQETIVSHSPGSILCNNLLEHVTDRTQLCTICERLLRPAGYLVVSAPLQYPYHPDPIDTGYRPGLEELRDLFGNLELVQGEIVSFGNYSRQLREKKWLLVRDAYLLAKSVWSTDARRVLLGNYSHLLRPYRETCAVFKKARDAGLKE